ncbi:MAG: hypothetical protein WDZ46_10575 [Solirubrobacterales bacterium]
MSLLVAWIVYPLVLLALCLGLGLLVDLLSGRRLPGALLAPVGLAAIVVVGQFTTLSDATAELTVPLLVLLAVLGAGLALPWRFGRPDPWAVGAALAVFAVFAAPVVLSGAATFAGYIKLDDTATWFALTDRVMEHGRSLTGLEPSTYRATLDFNLAAGYPVGIFLPFGAAQKLTGGDLAWVFQPYVSLLAAMLALGLWQIGGGFRRLLEQPALRALAVFVAAQPALLFGYAIWGGVKEVAAAVFIALAAALAPAAVRVADIDHPPVGSKSDAPDDARRVDAVLLALPAAALVGVLSLGGLVWLGPMLLALAVLAWRAFGPRDAVLQALAFIVPLALLVVPIIFGGGFSPFQSGLTEESEIGNLIEPLSPLQALGIWPSGDFRVDPSAMVPAAILIAIGLGAALYGLWVAWRCRAIGQLLFASGLLAAGAIVLVGSPWVDAKALAVAAPAVLALAMTGAIATLRLDRLTGVVLIAAVAGGVLWSNLLAYGGVSLAPYAQLVELEQIGEEFAGQGPALMTEYNPYGARHFLRELDAEGASELRVRPVTLRGGGMAEKGEAVDVDAIDLDALFEYRTLVLRRSPATSRPPLPYRLVWAGEHYEVWQRPAEPEGERVLSHQPVGGENDAGGLPNCSEVQGLGLLALSNQLGQPAASIRLVAAPRAPVHDATDGRFAVPRAGRYDAWLKGSVRGSVELLVDGSEVGAARHEFNNDGGYIYLGETTLGRGAHRAELRFGGADLHPGSGGFPRPETGPLLFAPVATEAAGALVSVPVDEADRLCGGRWDWIEAVGTG